LDEKSQNLGSSHNLPAIGERWQTYDQNSQVNLLPIHWLMRTFDAA
jgi:hypothetical protein